MKNVRMLLVVAMIAGLGQVASGQGLSKRDQLRAAVQQICPVSGQKLGENGPPTLIKVGQQTIFVCCKGCLNGKIKQEHWATIHANFAKAQGICPVMKHKLPKSPKWTIVQGQVVYVCCPPCTKKLAAEPEKYLQKLDELYAASLQAKQRR